ENSFFIKPRLSLRFICHSLLIFLPNRVAVVCFLIFPLKELENTPCPTRNLSSERRAAVRYGCRNGIGRSACLLA
ncbi:MAG: hypothetical protein IIU21_02060, partial [Schwartzia sp.]|nr:hypothetical protein [Schwartzia sp. (in: firmicutes)]